jgi:hypothetical protein
MKTILRYMDIPHKNLIQRGYDLYLIKPQLELHKDFVRINWVLVSKKEGKA